MPFALIFMGLILVVTGVKNTYRELGAQLKSDFTGEGNFLNWFVAIGVLGALGSIKELKTFSRVFLALVLIAMFLRNGGIFTQLVAAIRSGPVAPKRQPTIAETYKDINGKTVDPSTVDHDLVNNASRNFSGLLGIRQGDQTADETKATQEKLISNIGNMFKSTYEKPPQQGSGLGQAVGGSIVKKGLGLALGFFGL